MKNQINNNFHEASKSPRFSVSTTKLKFIIMITKWANKKLLIFGLFVAIVSREIKFIYSYSIMSLAGKTLKRRPKETAVEIGASLHYNPYLYYLFWRIYYEFNTLWSVNAIFMDALRMSIFNFSSFQFYLFNSTLRRSRRRRFFNTFAIHCV